MSEKDVIKEARPRMEAAAVETLKQAIGAALIAKAEPRR